MEKQTQQFKQVYLALGSNLSEPIVQLKKTISTLKNEPNLSVQKISSIYKSPPFDNSNQPDYFNCVLEVKTCLEPLNLLKLLKDIEKKQGRVQAKKWSARIIDIDILLFNDEKIDFQNLTIPHKSLKYRNFFLIPLMEICKKKNFEGIGNLKKHLEKINSPITKLS